MKVIRAGPAGFCMGVRRAVELAEKELAAAALMVPRARVYSLGPLIHNPAVLEKLEKSGLSILDGSSEGVSLEGAVVIIRAHGVSPAVEEEIRGRGGRVCDATCPRVKASQIKARDLAARGRKVFLAGEKRHAEISGIRGYAPSCLVAGNPAEASAAAEKLYGAEPDARTALIGQTTMTPREYRAIADGIRAFFPDLEVVDTLCGAVRDRQDALRSLSGKVDAFLIAGGKDSANTRRLLALAEAAGKPAWLVEAACELPPEIRLYETVGVAAGASTPDDVVDGIERALYGV
ncbi:MAG: 4-hydroxy-3-methylbut-2-enyl diphosphate reductase [Treponema sp.]|jgi:4-hydroxy-3-methylbut-2-enyl diphosphate reductase|nr:4-hydroxy-3-methylbut-2-enyl diphosphate reductase [Treponema sp.]